MCVYCFFLFLFARENIWEEKIHQQGTMFTLHQDERQFSFKSQTNFSARFDLPFSRRQAAAQQPKANTDVWINQPPDFSYRLYTSSNPSQKPRGKGKGEPQLKMTSESVVTQQLSRLRSRLLPPLLEKKRRVQKHSESMQGCDEEGQGSPGIEAGKGCQKQQEGLLQLHQQQKEG